MSYTEEIYDSLFHVHPLSRDKTSICQLTRSLITYTVHCSTLFIPAEVIRGRRGRCLPLRFPRGVQISSVQFSSVTQSCLTLCDPMNCSTPGLPVHHQLRSPPKLMSIESVMPSSYLILCCPLLLLPPIPPSIGVFSNESTLHMRWPKYWSFSYSISPTNEHPGLTSFRMEWSALLAVQGTLKSLLQHHSSKASIRLHSAFFTVQLSHPYKTTGKTIALTRWTFVGKVMSLLLNMLSRLVIAFLPRSKCLLISCLQSQSAVILEPKKINLSLLPLFPHLFAMK